MKCPECGSRFIDDEICVVCGYNIEVEGEVRPEEWDGEIPF